MKNSFYAQSLLLIFLVLLLNSCASQKAREIQDASQAMQLTSAPTQLADDLDRESLLKGIRDHIAYFTKNSNKMLRFGPRSISASDYLLGLKSFLLVVEQSEDRQVWLQFLKNNFDFYEIFGKEKWGEVFMTSYFDPIIRGSLKASKEFSQPLYMLPDDMVVIRMNSYVEKFPALEGIQSKLSEQKSGGGILRGRYSQGSTVGAVGEILPYFDREEIDSKKSLKGRKLEICYVNPIDAFVLQIQGSGTVMLEDGTPLKVGYASQNGHPYVAVGKFLTHAIPMQEMSLQRIESYLNAIPAHEAQAYMNKNPSYVFFQKVVADSLTTIGTEVIEGRTIATDPRYFPKGTLAFLEFSKPLFDGPNPNLPRTWQPTQRLVFDQDTGGAIRGPARLDLYWGKGPMAKKAAGIMKNWGRLHYLAPKETFLAENKRATAPQ